jgi:predicted secreted Zn-dependent protease
MRKNFLLLLLFLTGAGPAAAEPLSRVHASFYYVDGGSATVLVAQMDKNGPKAEDGKRYPSKTRWDVQWKYNHDQQGETCGVKDVAVAVGIAQNLPRWRGEDKPAGALAARWKKFAEAVKRHEDGHKEHGLKAAVEIETALQALKPASNCEDLDKAANAAGERIVEKYRKRDADYERSTDHGRRQGATLL